LLLNGRECADDERGGDWHGAFGYEIEVGGGGTAGFGGAISVLARRVLVIEEYAARAGSPC
jgi:hypothetical protein